MLIVGGVSSEEERDETLFIAQIVLLEERIKYLAKINKKLKK